MVLSTSDRSSWLRFATAYATALHRAGAPAPTIESEVTRVLGARGVEATLMASPTALWIDVDGSRVVRVGPAQTDLGRQVALAEVGERVTRGLAPDRAADEVVRVESAPTAWSDRAHDLAFLAASAGAAVLVGGSGTDWVAAGAIGWVAARLRRAAAARAGWAPLGDAVAAFAAGALAQGAAGLGADPARTALAAVAVLAPGMALTTAAGEVVTGHWTSGTARAAGALATLVQLGAGLAVAAMAVPAPAAWLLPWAGPTWVPWVAHAALPIALAVLGRTRPVDVGPAVGVAWLAGGVARAVGGPWGALAGATLTGAAGRWLGHRLHLPPAVVQSPALYLLVPGALGVDGLRRAIGGVDDGLATAWAVASVAVALAAGLVLGGAVGGPLEASQRRASTRS